MKARPPIEVPDDVMAKFRRADRLEWISLVLMISCAVLVYFTLGQSQAMKAVFVEDVLAIIPPAVYLVVSRWRFKEPNERFPYGYHHAITIGFLCSAVALLTLGTMVFFESLRTLLTKEHPTVGVMALFGRQIWIGWLAYPVLIYTIICEFTVGKIKTPVANELHDKALAADARMNRADWMSGASGMLGMTAIALGWWWGDSIAAIIISIEIIRDGFDNIKGAITDLMDEVPTKAEGEGATEWAENLCKRLKKEQWVRDVDVRLREEGNIISGEVFVVIADHDEMPKCYRELQKIAKDLDWRFYDLALVAVDRV
jgi:cation diffusion facilitator family transporter